MAQRCAVLLFLVALFSCSGLTGPEAAAGTYVLETIDGTPLPFGVAIYQDTLGTFIAAEETAGWIRLDADGSYGVSSTFTDRTLEGDSLDTRVLEGSGSYALSRDTVRFFEEGHPSRFGLLNGDVLTTSGQYTRVYRR